MKRLGLPAIAIALLLGLPPAAAAQPLPGSFELGVGGLWTGPTTLGSADATLTTSTGGTQRLFTTRTELAGAPGVEGRAAFRLFGALQLEGTLSYAWSDLRTEITSDLEGVEDTTAATSIQEFIAEAALVAGLSNLRIGNAIPFVSAGVGYLRQMHEGRTLIETGQVYHLAGGVKLPLFARPAGAVKSVGLRADVRAVFRRDGVAPADDVRVAPAVGVSLFLRF